MPENHRRERLLLSIVAVVALAAPDLPLLHRLDLANRTSEVWASELRERSRTRLRVELPPFIDFHPWWAIPMGWMEAPLDLDQRAGQRPGRLQVLESLASRQNQQMGCTGKSQAK